MRAPTGPEPCLSGSGSSVGPLCVWPRGTGVRSWGPWRRARGRRGPRSRGPAWALLSASCQCPTEATADPTAPGGPRASRQGLGKRPRPQPRFLTEERPLEREPAGPSVGPGTRRTSGGAARPGPRVCRPAPGAAHLARAHLGRSPGGRRAGPGRWCVGDVRPGRGCRGVGGKWVDQMPGGLAGIGVSEASGSHRRTWPPGSCWPLCCSAGSPGRKWARRAGRGPRGNLLGSAGRGGRWNNTHSGQSQESCVFDEDFTSAGLIPVPAHIEAPLPPGQPCLLPLVLLPRALSGADLVPQPDHHRPGPSPCLTFLTLPLAQPPGCCFSRLTHQGKVLWEALGQRCWGRCMGLVL